MSKPTSLPMLPKQTRQGKGLKASSIVISSAISLPMMNMSVLPVNDLSIDLLVMKKERTSGAIGHLPA